MNIYRNKKNGYVLLNGGTVKIQVCRVNGKFGWMVVSPFKQGFNPDWPRIYNVVIPEELRFLLFAANSPTGLLLLFEWMEKNPEALEKIYWEARFYARRRTDAGKKRRCHG